MSLSQRLRTCARHTGLDAVIELLTEAADEIDALQARAQVQGEPVTVAVDHFDNGPFEAYTNRIHPPVEIGAKLYTTPQPVQATQAEVTDERAAFEAKFGFSNSGIHHALWEGWKARSILALRPERVPMTDEQRLASWFGSPVDMSWAAEDAYAQGISDAEAHHGIAAQAKKETP